MRRLLVLFALAAAALCSANPALAQDPLYDAADTHWSDQFALPRVHGQVYCAHEYEGKLVVGGYFDYVGDVRIANLAVWDGATWSAFEGGTDGAVYSLMPLQGQLVVGGAFNRAGAVAARGIARWTGVSWEAFGAGLGGGYQGVRSLAVYHDELIAAGDFDRTGSVPLLYLSRWDGTVWRPMARLMDAPVLAIAVQGDSLFVAGKFSEIENATTGPVAIWDGQIWSGIGSAFPPQDEYYRPEIMALLPFHGWIVAGGRFGNYGTNQTLAWNGSNWDSLAYASRPVTSLASNQDTLFIGSEGALYTWPADPGVPPVPPLFQYRVSALAWWGSELVAATDGFVSGTAYDSVLATSLAIRRSGRWTGMIPWTDRMHGLTAGTYASVRALESYRGDLLATGVFRWYGDGAGLRVASGLAAWNGSSWRPFDLPTNCYSNYPDGLLADGDTLYVSTTAYCYPSIQAQVLRFDGTSWAFLDSLPIRVNAMTRYRGHLVVAGDRWDPQLYPSEVYELNDLGHWTRIGTTASYSGGTVTSMVVDGDRLVIGGVFEAVDNVAVSSVAEWDGTRWYARGSLGPIYYYSRPFVQALAVHRGVLIAATRTGWPQSILSWDGSRWNPLGSVALDPYTIASIGGELFAGGVFWSRGRIDGLVRWNGQQWEELGSGLDGPARVIKAYRGSLYVGGDFTRAGTHASYSIAAWNGLRATLGAPRVSLAPGAPNPFRSSSRIAYHLQEASGVHIVVCNVQGRRIRVLEHAWRDPGDHAVTWDGRDDDGRPMASGVYYVQLLIGEQVKTSQKIVLLR